MIDTVVLRMHGCTEMKLKTIEQIQAHKNGEPIMLVPEHFELFKVILQQKGKSFTRKDYYSQEKTEESLYTEDEFLLKEFSKKKSLHFLNVEKMRITDGDLVKNYTRSSMGNFRIPSSSSDINFKINPERGVIDFFVSIPKYLYMHNLSEFVPQIDSNNYKLKEGNFSNWDVQAYHLYDRLNSFIKRFFQEIYDFFDLSGFVPNYTYLELRRLDLCFNQHFESKDDALQYLDHQKKFHKKTKLYKNISPDYDSSIAFHTSRGEYFKIYHKGSEYKNVNHGDYNKHMRINKSYVNSNLNEVKNPFFNEEKRNFNYLKVYSNLIWSKFDSDIKDKKFIISEDLKEKLQHSFNYIYSKMPINVFFLKEEMDKVLRYEISISSISFNYLFKNYIFRKNCFIHKNEKKIYKKVKRYDVKPNSFKEKITKEERRVYDHMHSFLNKTCSITFLQSKDFNSYVTSSDQHDINDKENYEIQKYYEFHKLGTLLEKHFTFPFMRSFLVDLVKKFKKRIDSYQIKKIKPFDDLIHQVNQYNEIVKKKRKRYNENQSNIDKMLFHNKIMDEKRAFYMKGLKHNFQDVDVVRLSKLKYYSKPIEMLKESELRKQNLSLIRLSTISEIYRLIHDEGLSISDCKKRLKMSKDTFYRRLRILKTLNISLQHLKIHKSFDVPINFRKYYKNTIATNYKKDFFFKPIFSTYG